MSAATRRPHPEARRARRIRLDQLVVERGLAESRTRAQALVMAGRVRVGAGDAVRLDRKPGDLLDPATPLAISERDPYVSRGGHKLAAALDAFAIDPSGLVCLDAGASTGGFTDLLLQRGARRVYAVDVGRGQLAEALRRDGRVVSMERTNARSLGPGSLPERVALATADVSFISLGLVLGPLASCFGPTGGPLVVLVKPQFEAGRAVLDHGVVRDPAVHLGVLRSVVERARELGLGAHDAIASPLLGPDGNREFLLHLRVPPRPVGCRSTAADHRAGEPGHENPDAHGEAEAAPPSSPGRLTDERLVALCVGPVAMPGSVRAPRSSPALQSSPAAGPASAGSGGTGRPA